MKLTALQPIRHDGKRYAEGDVLDVSDKRQAEALIACGAAEAGGKAKSKAEAKAEAIAAAEKAVADAEAALAAAADDAAKDAAQQELDNAKAALQAAKA